jgi:hypothetical protein
VSKKVGSGNGGDKRDVRKKVRAARIYQETRSAWRIAARLVAANSVHEAMVVGVDLETESFRAIRSSTNDQTN